MCEVLCLISTTGNKKASKEKGEKEGREEERKEEGEKRERKTFICESEFSIIRLSFGGRLISYEEQRFCPWREHIK